jgi:hypothetical protein
MIDALEAGNNGTIKPFRNYFRSARDPPTITDGSGQV